MSISAICLRHTITLFSVKFIELNMPVDTVIEKIINWFNCMIKLFFHYDKHMSGHISCTLMKCSNTSVDC